MIKLTGRNVYLAALEREHCRKLGEDYEYDFENPAESLNLGYSVEEAEKWYDDIQKDSGKHIRLGIFLLNGTIIGDIGLQNVDWKNRKCDIGVGFSKLEHRNKGYGSEAVALLLEHAFNNMGLIRVEASTQDLNISAQKSLEKLGFSLEGRQRRSIYWGGKYHDRLMYAILATEYCNKR